MSNGTDTKDRRKDLRRSGLEMRTVEDRREPDDEAWPYFEKRSKATRRTGKDRREDSDRRHGPSTDPKDG